MRKSALFTYVAMALLLSAVVSIVYYGPTSTLLGLTIGAFASSLLAILCFSLEGEKPVMHIDIPDAPPPTDYGTCVMCRKPITTPDYFIPNPDYSDRVCRPCIENCTP